MPATVSLLKSTTEHLKMERGKNKLPLYLPVNPLIFLTALVYGVVR